MNNHDKMYADLIAVEIEEAERSHAGASAGAAPDQQAQQARCSVAAGSALFQRVMLKCDDSMRKVWEGTPWMVEAYTGSQDDLRWEEIRNWCEINYGPEAWPIHGRPGNWYRGGATINGFTWLGFATEEMMKDFEVNWATAPNNPGQPRGT